MTIMYKLTTQDKTTRGGLSKELLSRADLVKLVKG